MPNGRATPITERMDRLVWFIVSDTANGQPCMTRKKSNAGGSIASFLDHDQSA